MLRHGIYLKQNMYNIFYNSFSAYDIVLKCQTEPIGDIRHFLADVKYSVIKVHEFFYV